MLLNRKFSWGLLLLLAAALPSAHGKGADVSLSFGLYQSDKATVMYRKFVPVLEYLQGNMERQLGRPVDIQLRIFKTYEEANDAIVNGDVDFVRFGPASYSIAKDRNPNIQLLAMEHKKGKKRFKGVVVVAANSPIQSLVDLKGRRFAFGSKNSTIGRYLVQAELAKAGIRANDLGSYEYLGRHDKVFKAVALGDYDAGSVKESTYKRYNGDGAMRVLMSFDNVTKPWVAREGLEPELMQAIQQSLFVLTDTTVLKELKVSGFLPTSDGEYEFVREGMREASHFASDTQ